MIDCQVMNCFSLLPALPALVGKMYSKIHFSRARGWNEPQRHKGHKDRSIIMSIKLITQNLEEPQIAFTYRGQAYHITQSLASLPMERPSLSF